MVSGTFLVIIKLIKKGNNMRFLTSGESHGEALTVIISEYPSGIKIDHDYINSELSKRQMGFGRGARMSIESDEVKILSGVRKGVTTGSPVSFIINNIDYKNWKNKPEAQPVTNPRPGHADLPGLIKYRLNDIRDVIERSSARETASRVAIGAFARLFLKQFSVYVFSFVEQIGNIGIDTGKFRNEISRDFDPEKNKNDLEFVNRIESSILRCPDEAATDKMIKLIKKTIKEGDSLGGSVRVFASGMFPGLGSFTQWDLRLDAIIARSIMSIPSVKAVSFGLGEFSATLKGTKFHDEIYFDEKKKFYRKTNNAGGFEGGMTNGEFIDIKAVIKPIPTTTTGLKTVDIVSKKETISFKERSDVCAVPSISLISEAMLSIELMNAMQEKFGKDNIDEILENFKNYKKYISEI
jgi:chorismate synthase